MGYALHAGRSWRRDIRLADVEELQEHHTPEVYAERINANEVIIVKDRVKSSFPCVNGTIKLAGKHSDVRTSDSMRQGPEKIRALASLSYCSGC